ncbi:MULTISPECIES: GTP pyrophosphokinase family protein [unclassified Rhodococcus (in: high G+C Gram-positive bacteria)]|uniref:GTP pyrophosphokinase n=1 Tax=unclassified Rhodococcus (in: high G+C Gram-positive bacteria) TaxID=192944 RepID=UPI00031CB297|nr:GTP pyrophosphokinase family protein [Rhodococcus sp. DK17]
MTVDTICDPDLSMTTQFELFGPEFTQFVLPYQCAIATLTTKVHILRKGFTHLDRHCPIEHVSSRVKSPDSIMAKAQRLSCPLTVARIRQNIRDIAGVRVTCGLISDTYRVADLIGGQPDVTVLEVEDYIAKPKSNGYKSLHMAVEIPVFLSDRVVQVPVELQIRTIAMDFWASLEHKIYYKYQRSVPRRLLQELTEAADVAHRLDRKMERLHNEVTGLESAVDSDDSPLSLEAIEHGDRSPNRCGKPHNSTVGALVRYPPAGGVDVCRNTTHVTDAVVQDNTRG